MIRRAPVRRDCSGPRWAMVCAAASSRRGGHAHRGVLEGRIRSACRQRQDFTGRGFGRARQREAR